MATIEVKTVKTKTRHAFISAMNFLRVRILDQSELDTPEKRLRDQKEIEKAAVHYEKIAKNIETCVNKLQVDTVCTMMEQFEGRYGRLCYDKYIDLREKLNRRKDELCMYI